MRKLQHELGVREGAMTADDFTFLTRIYYKAACGDAEDKWAEHEIDYILFTRKVPEVAANENEVSATRWVSREEVKELLEQEKAEPGTVLTPWFAKIASTELFRWWGGLDDLASMQDADSIHRM